MLKKVISYIIFALTLFFMFMLITSLCLPHTNSVECATYFFIIIILAYVDRDIYKQIYLSIMHKKMDKQINKVVKADNKPITAKKLKPYSVMLTLINGIDLPEHTRCKIIVSNDNMTINYGNTNFILPNERICNVKVSADVTTNTQLISSAGGALTGGALFGVAGALVGGRVKKKEIKETSLLLIISYTKNDSIENILFDAGKSNLFAAQRLEKTYSTINNNNMVNVNL